MQAFHDREKHCEDAKILILPEFVPCQKFLSETSIAFVIFPSNRGGYCIQPQKKEYSMNYKCSFPSEWLGLENEELQEVTCLYCIRKFSGCHKEAAFVAKSRVKEQVKQILKYKPEAVFVGENLFAAYPIVHALRKKHIPVFGLAEKDGQKLIVRIPSGS